MYSVINQFNCFLAGQFPANGTTHPIGNTIDIIVIQQQQGLFVFLPDPIIPPRLTAGRVL